MNYQNEHRYKKLLMMDERPPCSVMGTTSANPITHAGFSCSQKLYKMQKSILIKPITENLIYDMMDRCIIEVKIDLTTCMTTSSVLRLSKIITHFLYYYKNLVEHLSSTLLQNMEEYFERVSILLAIYTDLELKASNKQNESCEEIANRISLNYFIFLKQQGCPIDRLSVMNTSDDPVTIIDIFLRLQYITKLYYDVIHLLFQYYLMPAKITPEFVDDRAYIKRLIVYKRWIAIDDTERTRDKIRSTFKCFKPKDSLNMKEYMHFLPREIMTCNDDIYLINASVLDKSYALNPLMKIVQKEMDRRSAERRQRRMVDNHSQTNRSIVPGTLIDLTDEDEDIFNKSPSWLGNLQQKVDDHRKYNECGIYHERRNGSLVHCNTLIDDQSITIVDDTKSRSSGFNRHDEYSLICEGDNYTLSAGGSLPLSKPVLTVDDDVHIIQHTVVTVDLTDESVENVWENCGNNNAPTQNDKNSNKTLESTTVCRSDATFIDNMATISAHDVINRNAYPIMLDRNKTQANHKLIAPLLCNETIEDYDDWQELIEENHESPILTLKKSPHVSETCTESIISSMDHDDNENITPVLRDSSMRTPSRVYLKTNAINSSRSPPKVYFQTNSFSSRRGSTHTIKQNNRQCEKPVITPTSPQIVRACFGKITTFRNHGATLSHTKSNAESDIIEEVQPIIPTKLLNEQQKKCNIKKKVVFADQLEANVPPSECTDTRYAVESTIKLRLDYEKCKNPNNHLSFFRAPYDGLKTVYFDDRLYSPKQSPKRRRSESMSDSSNTDNHSPTSASSSKRQRKKTIIREHPVVSTRPIQINNALTLSSLEKDIVVCTNVDGTPIIYDNKLFNRAMVQLEHVLADRKMISKLSIYNRNQKSSSDLKDTLDTNVSPSVNPSLSRTDSRSTSEQKHVQFEMVDPKLMNSSISYRISSPIKVKQCSVTIHRINEEELLDTYGVIVPNFKYNRNNEHQEKQKSNVIRPPLSLDIINNVGNATTLIDSPKQIEVSSSLSNSRQDITNVNRNEMIATTDKISQSHSPQPSQSSDNMPVIDLIHVAQEKCNDSATIIRDTLLITDDTISYRDKNSTEQRILLNSKEIEVSSSFSDTGQDIANLLGDDMLTCSETVEDCNNSTRTSILNSTVVANNKIVDNDINMKCRGEYGATHNQVPSNLSNAVQNINVVPSDTIENEIDICSRPLLILDMTSSLLHSTKDVENNIIESNGKVSNMNLSGTMDSRVNPRYTAENILNTELDDILVTKNEIYSQPSSYLEKVQNTELIKVTQNINNDCNDNIADYNNSSATIVLNNNFVDEDKNTTENKLASSKHIEVFPSLRDTGQNIINVNTVEVVANNNEISFQPPHDSDKIPHIELIHDAQNNNDESNQNITFCNDTTSNIILNTLKCGDIETKPKEVSSSLCNAKKDITNVDNNIAAPNETENSSQLLPESCNTPLFDLTHSVPSNNISCKETTSYNDSSSIILNSLFLADSNIVEKENHIAENEKVNTNQFEVSSSDMRVEIINVDSDEVTPEENGSSLQDSSDSENIPLMHLFHANKKNDNGNELKKQITDCNDLSIGITLNSVLDRNMVDEEKNATESSMTSLKTKHTNSNIDIRKTHGILSTMEFEMDKENLGKEKINCDLISHETTAVYSISTITIDDKDESQNSFGDSAIGTSIDTTNNSEQTMNEKVNEINFLSNELLLDRIIKQLAKSSVTVEPIVRRRKRCVPATSKAIRKRSTKVRNMVTKESSGKKCTELLIDLTADSSEDDLEMFSNIPGHSDKLNVDKMEQEISFVEDISSPDFEPHLPEKEVICSNPDISLANLNNCDVNFPSVVTGDQIINKRITDVIDLNDLLVSKRLRRNTTENDTANKLIIEPSVFVETVKKLPSTSPVKKECVGHKRGLNATKMKLTRRNTTIGMQFVIPQKNNAVSSTTITAKKNKSLKKEKVMHASDTIVDIEIPMKTTVKYQTRFSMRKQILAPTPIHSLFSSNNKNITMEEHNINIIDKSRIVVNMDEDDSSKIVVERESTEDGIKSITPVFHGADSTTSSHEESKVESGTLFDMNTSDNQTMSECMDNELRIPSGSNTKFSTSISSEDNFKDALNEMAVSNSGSSILTTGFTNNDSLVEETNMKLDSIETESEPIPRRAERLKNKLRKKF